MCKIIHIPLTDTYGQTNKMVLGVNDLGESSTNRVTYVIEKQKYNVLGQVIEAWNFGLEHRDIVVMEV